MPRMSLTSFQYFPFLHLIGVFRCLADTFGCIFSILTICFLFFLPVLCSFFFCNNKIHFIIPFTRYLVSLTFFYYYFRDCLRLFNLLESNRKQSFRKFLGSARRLEHKLHLLLFVLLSCTASLYVCETSYYIILCRYSFRLTHTFTLSVVLHSFLHVLFSPSGIILLLPEEHTLVGFFSAGLLVLNSLGSCLCRNNFILPTLLEDFFPLGIEFQVFIIIIIILAV